MTAAWRWPPLVFLSGQAVSVLGDGLAVLAIPLLILDLTRNPLVWLPRRPRWPWRTWAMEPRSWWRAWSIEPSGSAGCRASCWAG